MSAHLLLYGTLRTVHWYFALSDHIFDTVMFIKLDFEETFFKYIVFQYYFLFTVIFIYYEAHECYRYTDDRYI